MDKYKWYKNLIGWFGRHRRKIIVTGIIMLLLGWLLASFPLNSKLTLPVFSVEPWLGQDKSAPFISLEDGGLKIGTNTIRISRFRLDMGNLKIVNLADPTTNQDAATKAYVDAAGSVTAYRTTYLDNLCPSVANTTCRIIMWTIGGTTYFQPCSLPCNPSTAGGYCGCFYSSP